MDDLKRWGIAHINLTGRKLGRHVLRTAYETGKPMMPLTSVNPVIIRKIYPLLYGLYEGSDPNGLTMDVL